MALPTPRGFYMYVLACADGSLYTGYTVELPKRLAAHNAGVGAKYTRARLPVQVKAWCEFPDRRAAMRAEAAFKRLSRSQKLRQIPNLASWACRVTDDPSPKGRNEAIMPKSGNTNVS